MLGPQAGGYVSTVAWPRGGVIFVGYVPADPAKTTWPPETELDVFDVHSITMGG